MLKIVTNTPQNHSSGCEVLCFDGKPAVNSSYDPKHLITFDSIMKNLPSNWIPDLLIFKTPQFYPIPINIEECPFTTVLLLDDWFGSTDYLPDNMARFDYIFTDRFSVTLLKRMGFSNVDYWPCFGYDPVLYHVLQNEPKTIDVSFAGSFNSNIQAKRLPYLHRLCKLPEKYVVKLYHDLWKDEYLKVLNQSKIVFNRSIKGEMNLRCFQAPACKALLFIEEENTEIREFLEPGKECVVYNDTNLEECIEYYLEHEEERCRITEAGYEKIQNFTYVKLFDTLLRTIESKEIITLKNRRKTQSYASSVLHRDFVQVNLSLRGRTDDVFPIVTELLKQEPVSSIILNDCAVILLAYLEDREKTMAPEHIETVYGYCVSLLEKAWEHQNSYITPLFNLAQVNYIQKRYSQAALLYQQTLRKPINWIYEDFKGLVFPLHYFSPLRYLWSDALANIDDDGKDVAKSRQNVITYIACMQLAEIAYHLGNNSEGQSWLKRAIDIFPSHPSALTSYVSHLSNDELSLEDQKILITALEKNPFFTKHWEVYLKLLSNSGNLQESIAFAKACQLSLSRVQFADKTTIDIFNRYLTNVSQVF